MAFTRPTLTQILTRVKGDFKTGLGITAILRRSFIDITAKVISAVSHTLHGHIDYALRRKFFLDTGDEATVVRWGTLYNLPRNEASFAQLVIDVVGTTGNTLLIDRIFVRSDGLEYTVLEETVIPAATTVPVTVVASEEGVTGNMEVAETLELQSALAGVESEAAVSSIDVEGQDEEDIEDYKQRVLARMQTPPAGGTVNDYIAFALTVTGVTRAWVLPNHLGQGTVAITFLRDDDVDPIPSAAEVTEVQETVLALQPINADLTTFAPTTKPLDPVIVLKPNTTDVQNAVIAELEDLLVREAQVRDASDPDQVGLGVQFDGVVLVSLMNEAISLAAGEEDHVMTSPTIDVQPNTGGIVVLGTPTFSELL